MIADQRQLTGQFLEMLAAERGAADNTLQAYRHDLDDFLAFLVARDRTLTAVVPADISAYLRTASESGLAPSSRARRLSAIRQLFKFLANEGLVAEDPAHGLAGPKKARALPKTLSVAEVDRLIETARARIEPARGRDRVRALRLYALIEMLYATGMRVSELVTLPRSVLTGDGRVLAIKGKGGRERLVPLNQAARLAIERYLNVGFEDGVAPHAEHEVAVRIARRGRALHAPAPGPGAEGTGDGSRHRSRAGVAACLAPRLRQPPAGSRRGPALGAAAARACRHIDHADLHARPGRTAKEVGVRASSAGSAGSGRELLSSNSQTRFQRFLRSYRVLTLSA
ncbi:MAG: site-specific integrase [Rhodospirillales bacterium]|nr:site-specific integrase [Rhodospirillales bacterium]